MSRRVVATEPWESDRSPLRRGLIDGRWVERAGQRRRRYYRLTPAGRKVLLEQRTIWEAFFLALDRVARISHA